MGILSKLATYHFDLRQMVVSALCFGIHTLLRPASKTTWSRPFQLFHLDPLQLFHNSLQTTYWHFLSDLSRTI